MNMDGKNIKINKRFIVLNEIVFRFWPVKKNGMQNHLTRISMKNMPNVGNSFVQR